MNPIPWRDKSLYISLNPMRLSLTLEGNGHPEVYNYDLSGRVWNVFVHGQIHQRGLDGKVVAKWSDPQSGRGRRWLSVAEADALVQKASAIAAAVGKDIQSGKIKPELESEGDLIPLLHAAGSYASHRSAKEIARFQEIYTPVGILPPDQYQAVLLQASEGCSFNACTFCEFYKDRRFHIKSNEEFRKHAYDILEFLGHGLSLRRTIFLGDANALVIPTDRILDLMAIASEIYDVEALGGFYAFLDGFSGEKKSKSDYQRLRAAGLERVYIGLESGHDPLLRFLNKPGDAADALNAVRKLKAGGVPVAIIVLLGAGGEKFARGHVEDTVRLIHKMKLDMHDQIYFSELIELEGMPYAMDAFRSEINPLDHESLLDQAAQIHAQLRFNARSGTPHMSRYDIREFVY